MTAVPVLLPVLIFCVVFTCVDGQVCREGWQYFGGSCYGFGDTWVTWADAQAICKAFNGKLAEIETAEENDYVKNIARSKHAHATYVGGTDIFDEGVWQWASGGDRIYPFLDWGKEQPDSDGNQDCIALLRDFDFKWDDYICSTPDNFICETKSTEGELVG